MDRKVVPLNHFAGQIPLLQTKLLVPHTLSGLVPRQRLNDSLDRALQGKLTLVTAPAGFGKTTVIAEWIRRSSLPVAWLSLASGENDPVRFWNYLAASVNKLQPGMGDGLTALLRSSTNPPWEAAISLLIDDLAGVPFDFALVLDDYHLLNEPLVHDTLFFLVRYAPQRMHPVISGRSEPPLPLSRLRAIGQVAELTARDLCFTGEEATAFYQQRNIHLTGEEVAKLVDRTGGWAAGMQMTALSLLAGGDKSAVIERFQGSDRHLSGYFMEEVFDRFPEPAQSFLLQTSILGRLSGPLCEAVTGEQDGNTALSIIARQGGFMACLDEKEGWYGYHHLFAEFLRSILKQRDPAQIPVLHRQAARWFEANDLVAEAVEHYLQGGEHERAVGLIERQAPGMLGRGETATLAQWLRALPSAVVHQSLRLCMAQAMTEVAADRMDGVEYWLERAEALCREQEEKQPAGGEDLMGLNRVLLKIYLAVKRRDVPAALYWTARAGQTRDDTSPFAYGLMFEKQEPSLLGGPMGWFGRLKEKAQGMESGVYLKLRELVQPAARRGYVLVANAEALYEWDQIDAAVKSLLEGMEEARAAGDAGVLLPALFTLARVRLARGDLGAALEVAAEGEKQVHALGQPQWLAALAALRARIHLVEGNTEAVADWLEHSRLDVYDRLSTARAYEHITLGRVLMAGGRGEDAIFLMERLLAFAKQEQHLPRTIETSNLLALAHDAVGRTSQAMEVLRENLTLARENGYLRTFVDEGAPMLSLLRRLARPDGLERQENEAAYVRRLVTLLRRSPVLHYPGLQAPPPSTLVEPLTAKELAVLRLVAAGLDNRSVAGAMSIELQTVKTHLTSIYGKLGVAGRREATERAQGLGLLRTERKPPGV